MGDAIAIKTITVYVQENGIIRLNDSGRYIGRLEDITYDDLPQAIVTNESA